MSKIQTLVSQIFLHSLTKPNKSAIIAENHIITYSTLWERITRVANYFTELGYKKGDRIILTASNSPSFIYGYFAAHLIKAVAVPVDPNLPKIRMDYIINNTLPKGIFLTEKIDSLNSVRARCLQNIQFPLENQYADMLFTSGTTGEPKGVVLTHKNIFAAARNINLFVGNKENDKEVIPLPLSHSFGLGRLRCNFLVGSTIILCNGFINPIKVLQLLKTHKATGFCSVPTGLAILLKFSKDEISKLKNKLNYIEIGSAPMTIQHKKELMQILPKTRICMHYGLTEASRSMFLEFHTDSNKLNSIGKPTPNVRVKICDDKGKETPKRTIGSIMIKADTVMHGYFNNQKATKGVLNNGWFATQDLGYIDDDGYYYLAGRKSELINIGGQKVFAQEVESILNKYKGIKESACVGITDPNGITGQIIKACLVSTGKNKPDITQLIAFLRQYLEEYKIPKVFKWMDSIPKTTSGKIQRGLL